MNQAFTATPNTKVNKPSSTGATYTDTASLLTYTISNLGTGTVNVAFFPCTGTNAPKTNADGVTTFTPPGGSAPVAGSAVGQGTTDQGAVNGILITSINGAPVANAKFVNTVTPSNGSVTVTVNNSNTNSADCGNLVVWRDGESVANNALTLAADGKPTEAFGMSGQVNYIPAEGAAGAIGTSTVTQVDKTAKFFVNTGGTYYYKTGDTYQVKLGGTCTNTTEADFLGKLSVGDTAEGVYSKNAASTFCINDVAPVAPASLTAVATTSATSVTLTWSDSSTASAVSYNLYRSTQAAGVCTTFPTSGATTPYALLINRPDVNPGSAGGVATTYIDATTAASTSYCYAIKAVDTGGQEGSGTTQTANTVLTNAAVAATAPYTTNLSFITGGTGDNATVLDAGDQVIGQFNVAIDAPVAGDTVTVMDGLDGDTFVLTNGTNATFTRSGTSNNVLTVALTGAPVVQAAPGNAIPTTGETATAGPLQHMIVISSTVGNSVGDWNTARSGINAANFERVFGNDFDTPNPTNAVLAVNGIVANANDLANTVPVDGGSVGTVNDTVSVYNQDSGALLGEKAIAVTANDDVVTTSGFTESTPLLTVDHAVTTKIPSRTATLTVAPFITAAVITNAGGGTAGFGNDVGDAIALTFSSSVSLDALVTGATNTSFAEINSIIGAGAGVNPFTNAVATTTVSGNVVTITITTADASGLVVATDTVQGTANTLVTDGTDGMVLGVTPPAAT